MTIFDLPTADSEETELEAMIITNEMTDLIMTSLPEEEQIDSRTAE